ncbi:MAG: tetratricopeptide repeat protein [Candidatus Binatia bacterium]
METTKERVDRAVELWQRGYQAQLQGDLGVAMRRYQESLALHPTAEAYTFLGWAYSLLGRYEQAIEECKNAISLDPDFGNPYNDIGSYLSQLGNFDEAIPWLERAVTTTRYDARHFPHINLGRIYWAKGDLLSAAREFGKALELQPHHRFALHARAALSALLN